MRAAELDDVEVTPRRAAFRIDQFRESSLLSREENAFRARGVKAYFGWDSVVRMETEFQLSIARWFYLFPFHQPVDIDALLERLRTNQPTFVDESAAFQRSAIPPLDIFSLPFRHLTKAETMEELSLDYGIRFRSSVMLSNVCSAQYASLLLRNAAVFVALIWAPRYFRWCESAAELQQWTKESFMAMLSVPRETSCVLLADLTELICESSKQLHLQSYLYSSKLKHTHSLKLLTVCALSKRIVWRAALFGGGTSEDVPFELFLKSKEFHSLRAQGIEHVFIFTDRGIFRYRIIKEHEVHHLTPGLLPAGGHYPEGHCVWKQVRRGLLVSTHNS